MIENIKILHLAFDEKFIDIAYKHFETVAPSCNTFLIPSMRKLELKHVKKTPIKFINPLSFKNSFFMKSLEKYNFIVLHSLTEFNQELVAHASPRLNFVWIGMGYDYYDMIYNDSKSLHQEQTRDIVKDITNKNNIHNNLIEKLVKEIFYKNIEKKEIIEKINFFAPVLENEYEMVASKFRSNFPHYIDWNYGGSTIDMIEGKMNHYSLNGNNILVGNSATPTNNHLEIFEFLRAQSLNGKRIVCPLNYGVSEYASVMRNKGRIYFGDKFLSIDNFMTFEEYIYLVSSCSNVIMNHQRQQGLGTVSAMLYLGAKVFFNEKNPIYDFFRKSGAVIFSIDELKNNPSLLDFYLSKEDIEKNRQILKSKFSEKIILSKTENLIKTVISSSKSSNLLC